MSVGMKTPPAVRHLIGRQLKRRSPPVLRGRYWDITILFTSSSPTCP